MALMRQAYPRFFLGGVMVCIPQFSDSVNRNECKASTIIILIIYFASVQH